ncbi:MAG TPA: glycosyl hydrolase family 18 protein [Candidatus Dormibacteraeota bacterium]|nr:glycosyl hydrolase family 18 protein [Candidatus Dormibacteraeota bacterium]
MSYFVSALVIGVAFGGFATQSVSAKTETRTVVVRAATPGPQREVFGFALGSSLSDSTVGYPSWDFSLLSTVAYFGLHVQDDGSFAADSDWTTWNSSALTNLVSTAHSHGTKVVLTIVLQDFNPNTPHMCAGLINGGKTITNTVNEMKAKGVDGINVDYEGLNGSCGTSNPSWARDDFVNFMSAMRSNMPSGSYLSVDTYASSAADPVGFFNVGGLNGSVDSFFVMAYDLEYSNYARPPTSCSSFCLGPTAPLGGYYYNDTVIASQYVAGVGASKVILGVPYYGRKACVVSGSPNAVPTGAVTADTYLDASTEAASNLVLSGSYNAHRDANDPAGQERWDTWFNTSLNCTRELYWDDVTSLSNKYALIARDNLRGVGIWNLNYGGAAPELWGALNTYFSCPAQISVAATQNTTGITVGLSGGSCSVSSFDVQQMDTTINTPWASLRSVSVTGSSVNAIADGYPGHVYQFRARSHAKSGVVSGWSYASTQVSPSATKARAWSGLYTLDGFGGVQLDDSPPLFDSAYWPGWNIARAAKPLPGGNPSESGLVLDGYGGLHSYGAPAVSESGTQASHRWGFDIARDFAFLPDGTGGFVLDGYGGLHGFRVNGNTAPLVAVGGPFWGGWDIARKVVIWPDGTGGYVLDGYGGVHAFGINNALPAGASQVAATSRWGFDIARDIVLVAGNGGRSGYVLDGYGGTHPFHPTGDGSAMPASLSGVSYWGWDIARAMWLEPGSASVGYTLDGYGGIHPFGGAPAIVNSPYWPGWDIAKDLWGS